MLCNVAIFTQVDLTCPVLVLH